MMISLYISTNVFCHLLLIFVAEYANLPLIPPFLQPGLTQFNNGVNFASGGGGALVETFQGSVSALIILLWL